MCDCMKRAAFRACKNDDGGDEDDYDGGGSGGGTCKAVLSEALAALHPGETDATERRDAGRHGGGERSVRRDSNHAAGRESEVRPVRTGFIIRSGQCVKRARESRVWARAGRSVTVRAVRTVLCRVLLLLLLLLSLFLALRLSSAEDLIDAEADGFVLARLRCLTCGAGA